MNLRRAGLVLRQDLRENTSRPLFWIWMLLLVLVAWGLSRGDVRIASGDAQVGGTKAWITSQFAMGQMLSMVVFIFYAFFLAVIAGMAIIRDDELKVGEILHATPLTPSEYVWGKFLGILTLTGIVLAVHLTAAAFCNHILPNAKADEIRGPFLILNYLVPAIVFGLPPLLFLAGTSFAVGALFRRPILVFVLPLALLLFCAFFLWDWSPTWLDPRINRALMLIEPAGFRWLNETWLKVDRGVQFYNTAPIGLDGGFLLSRLAFVLAGLAAIVLTQRRFQSTLRGRRAGAASRRTEAALRDAAAPAAPAGADVDLPIDDPLSTLGMRTRPAGFLSSTWRITRFEIQGLASSPGLYLFIPIILLQTIGSTLFGVGAFETPLLVTSGTVAVRAMNTITLLVCFLLLFYTIESLQRERTAGLAAIGYATPIRTGSLILGKALANSFVGVVILLATFLACVITILIQGKVQVELSPFLLVWGLLLIPTFLFWSAFAAAAFALTRNRYTAYAVGLGALALTGYLQMTGRMTWVGNWDLWGVLRWSDMGPIQLDRQAVLLNRLLVLATTVFLAALTVRFFPRRESDPTQILHRLGPSRVARGVLRFLPYAAVPLVLTILLGVQVRAGYQGSMTKKTAHDYWKQNLATWKDAPLPALAAVDLDLTIEPSRRWFRTEGTYRLFNSLDAPMRQIALTGGPHWRKIHWTLDGKEYSPEDRTRLFVFTPSSPLQHGDSVTIGFSYEGTFPEGISRNGGGSPEFILPSGVVLTSFRPSFAPTLGYDEEQGVEEKNRYEPRVYADDFYEGITLAGFGSSVPARTRIRISGPAEYVFNSVGSLVSEEVQGKRRTVVWESDHPVRFFNVVGGKWAVRKGEGTAIYYHPEHTYNIDEMITALDASRRYYSEWFYPFPWKELKLSEFPALASYAQGFPTNITFSEGIGFLTRSDPKANAAFLITAHESAHQWWGNIVTPGKGPGGNIISEGLAHFSTILLTEQILGPRQRIETCKRLEEKYGNDRQADSERPMVKIEGSKPGDETVTYDKGGWVFWMLLNHMGRENMLAGMREFVGQYADGPDYPVLQDLVRVLRPFATDSTAYDAFVRQWFFEVQLPEYKLSEARKTQAANAAGTERISGADPAEAPRPGSGQAGASWEVAVRVRNTGTGAMPVEVAAVRGERFPKEPPADPSAAYEESRVSILLGPGEEQDVALRCSFEPERVLMDPDALVLQLERKSALVRF